MLTNDIRLLGFIGKAGSGKDTLADELAKEGWEKVAFSDAIKRFCIEYLGLSHDDVFTQEGKMRMNPTWGMTNRSILQKVGTDAMRNGFHKDVWIKICQLRVSKLLEDGRKVIVTDCRFDSEAQMVEDMGGVVAEIVRDGSGGNLTDEERSHSTEQPLDPSHVSFVVENNGTVSDLIGNFHRKLDGLAKKETER